jgi:hypothetical protein
MDLNQRLPGENDRQYSGYVAYRDMPQPRTLLGSYQIYSEKDGKSSKKLTSHSASWKVWADRFEWAARAREWDLEQEAGHRAAAEAEGAEAYKRDLKKFRDGQLSIGWACADAASQLKDSVLRFLEATPEIRTWEDCDRAARMLVALHAKSSEQLAKALYLEALLKEGPEPIGN